VWVVAMEGKGAVQGERAAAAALGELPGAEIVPLGAGQRAVFEGTILDELRVEAAVGGVAEVLEKDADEIGAETVIVAVFGAVGAESDRVDVPDAAGAMI